MSYILDALKKSEQERQENQAPTVHSIYPGSRFSKEKSSTPWLMIVLLISIISGLMVSGFWWYSRTGQFFTATGAEKKIEGREEALPVNEQQPLKETTVLQNESSAEAIVTVKETGSVPPVVEKTAVPSESQVSHNSKTPLVTVSADVPEDPIDQELLPIMQLVELPDAVRSTMPPMTYSFHVYSTDKNKCTIIINDRRYREGELIGAGWFLDTITETGIIVRKDRYRAAIQVVDNW